MDMGKTSCESIQRHLDSFVSGEVSAETREQVSRHLGDCPDCSAYVATLSKVRQSLRRAVEQEPVPQRLEARVRDRIRSHESKRSGIFAWAPAFGLAAAVLLVLLGGWHGWNATEKSTHLDQASQERYIDSLLARLATVFQVGLGDHLHCAHFREFPQDTPSLEEMTTKMEAEYATLIPAVRDQIPTGHHIALAHQCTYRGRRFVHMITRGNRQLLSIVITRKQAGESFTSASLTAIKNAAGVSLYGSTADQFEIAGFEAGDHLAFIVSDMGREENLQWAVSLAPSVHRFLAAMQG